MKKVYLVSVILLVLVFMGSRVSAQSNRSFITNSNYSDNYSFTASVMDVIRGMFGLKRVSDGPEKKINTTNSQNNTIIKTEEVRGSGASASQLQSQSPSIPTELKATALSTNQIKLMWKHSLSNSTNSVGYEIYRDGKKLPVTTTYNYYTDTGLSPNTAYSYYVVAYTANNAKRSNPSASVTEWTKYYQSGTANTDTEPPSIPTNVKVIPVSSNQLRISWSASTDNKGVNSYRVYRNGLVIASGSFTEYIDTGLQVGKDYTYTVRAVDNIGNISNDSVSVTEWTIQPASQLDTVAPSIPANVKATAKSSSEISLQWSASTDNTSVDMYKIYRDGLHRVTVYSTNYTDAGLQSGQDYTYTIRACDKAGNCSNNSASVTEWTQ